MLESIKTVSGYLVEFGDISRFDNPKQLQKLAGLAMKENSSGKHKGESGDNDNKTRLKEAEILTI